VTGRATGSTILHGATRKNLNSREFASALITCFNDCACVNPTVPPHSGPIEAASVSHQAAAPTDDYSLREIGEHRSCHYSTFSRRPRREEVAMWHCET
jgi:hypothetical protein